MNSLPDLDVMELETRFIDRYTMPKHAGSQSCVYEEAIALVRRIAAGTGVDSAPNAARAYLAKHKL